MIWGASNKKLGFQRVRSGILYGGGMEAAFKKALDKTYRRKTDKINSNGIISVTRKLSQYLLRWPAAIFINAFLIIYIICDES